MLPATPFASPTKRSPPSWLRGSPNKKPASKTADSQPPSHGVLSPAQAHRYALDPAAKDAPSKVLSYTALLSLVKNDPSWKYTGHDKDLKDVELYQHSVDRTLEIMVLSEDNAIYVCEGEQIYIYSPSSVLAALTFSAVPLGCSLFVRTGDKLKYKGLYSSSQPQTPPAATKDFASFDEKTKNNIVKMNARIRGWSEAYARERCENGSGDLRQYVLHYKGFDRDFQQKLLHLETQVVYRPKDFQEFTKTGSNKLDVVSLPSPPSVSESSPKKGGRARAAAAIDSPSKRRRVIRV